MKKNVIYFPAVCIIGSFNHFSLVQGVLTAYPLATQVTEHGEYLDEPLDLHGLHPNSISSNEKAKISASDSGQAHDGTMLIEKWPQVRANSFIHPASTYSVLPMSQILGSRAGA
jgi:hypothetical protein